ncbi:MAG: hypothetical protein ACK5BQ_04655, partial [Ignavibacteria bacterium]
PAEANAIIADALTTTVDIRENTIRDYTETALSLLGANGTILVKYNEFYNNNTGAASNSSTYAALTFAGGTITGSAEIQNNLFGGAEGDGNKNCIYVTGTITGKTISVQYNKFQSTVSTYYAIKNAGSGSLSASCNAYGNNVAGSTVRNLTSGSVEAGPYNSVGTDADGNAIGFEPATAEKCATDGPVKTTGQPSKSYFRIQPAIDASSAGNEVKISADTYTENLTINKNLTIRTYTANGATLDTADARSKNSGWVELTGTITVTSAAGTVTINGIKFTDATNASSQVIVTNASVQTNINNCWIDIDPSSTISTIPTNGAIHLARAGQLLVFQSKITRPAPDGSEYIRALTCASGNGSKLVHVENSNIEGTIQLSGLSSLSVVTIKGNNIDDAGIDGISVTGNTIKNLTIQQNTIDGSRQNGIGFRNSANFGSSSANIVNNKILNSGGAGSG